MARNRRFITIVFVAAITVGLGLSVVSIVVAPLPVAMSVFTSINAGLIAAGADARRFMAGRRTNTHKLTGGMEIGAVVVITGGALIGSQALFTMSPEMFLSTALLVLTTGYAGFYLGLLANMQESGHTGKDAAGKGP